MNHMISCREIPPVAGCSVAHFTSQYRRRDWTVQSTTKISTDVYQGALPTKSSPMEPEESPEESAQALATGKPDDSKTLRYHLLGPSLTKAGQDKVDQSKVRIHRGANYCSYTLTSLRFPTSYITRRRAPNTSTVRRPETRC